MAVREPAGRPAHAAAHVDDMVRGGHVRGGGEGVHRGGAAIVVLVEVFQLLFSERIEIGAARGQPGEDFVFVDRVRIEEADDAGLVCIRH